MKLTICILLAIFVGQELLALTIKGIRGPSNNPWAGGNGCNLIGGEKRLPCCTDHDKAYKEGGWVIARLNADAQLFTCFIKTGGLALVLAPVAFIGARAFGMWAFQYGKKREIKD